MAKDTREPDHLDHLQDELIASDAAIVEAVRARRPGGAKLARSETITVRLDPKLSWLCELAARAHRRTKSSYVEWAIERSLQDVGIPGEYKDFGPELTTIAERNMQLWDVEEADRLIALVKYAPSLLTHEEQRVWKIVATSPYLWRGQWSKDGPWHYDSSNLLDLIDARYREMWPIVKAVADGQDDRANHWKLGPLSEGQAVERGVASFGTKGGGFHDLDEDPPF